VSEPSEPDGLVGGAQGDDGQGADEGADANTVPAANARTVLEYLARAVVEEPDAVEIDMEEGRRGGVTLNVRVGPGDMGRVIGKRGRVAQSIRTVVRAAAVRDGVNVDVEFVD
jgi:predicted RNA-binding protein YlqC (UPF0109 family)